MKMQEDQKKKNSIRDKSISEIKEEEDEKASPKQSFGEDEEEQKDVVLPQKPKYTV